MAQRYSSVVTRFQRSLASALTSTSALAFLPALSLAAFWFGGEATLIVVSAVLPIIFSGLWHHAKFTSDLARRC